MLFCFCYAHNTNQSLNSRKVRQNLAIFISAGLPFLWAEPVRRTDFTESLSDICNTINTAEQNLFHSQF